MLVACAISWRHAQCGLTGRSTRTRTGSPPRAARLTLHFAPACRYVPVISNVRLPLKPTTFFRVALAVPLVVPFAVLPFGMNAVVGVFLLSLAFGGVQYVLFAGALFLAIGRFRSAERITRLSFWAPVLFVPVQAAGWLLYVQHSEPQGQFEPSQLLPGAVYSLLLGYAYVVVVNAVYHLFSTKGWVGEAPAA